MDSRVQDEWHWSCEGTTASVKEDYVVSEVLLVEQEGFRVLSSTRDLYVYENCPFDTDSRIVTQPLILAKVFTRLNCVVPVGLSFLPFQRCDCVSAVRYVI